MRVQIRHWLQKKSSRKRNNRSGTVDVQSYWVPTTSRLEPTLEQTLSQVILHIVFWQEKNQGIAQIGTMFYAPRSRLYVLRVRGYIVS